MKHDRTGEVQQGAPSSAYTAQARNALILPPDGTLIYVSEWRRMIVWVGFGYFALGSFSIAVAALLLGSLAGLGIAIGSFVNAAFCARMPMTGISLEPGGVRLRTALRTYHWTWDEIERFELKPRGYIPRLRIHLRDGRVKKSRGLFARRRSEEERCQRSSKRLWSGWKPERAMGLIRRSRPNLIGQSDAERLIAALTEEKAKRSALRRLRLVNALGKLEDARAVEPLSKVLVCDPNAEVRSMAVIALARIGDLAGAPALRRAVSSRTAIDQIRAIRSLGAMRDSRSVPLLIARLQSTDFAVRVFAADALGDLGDPAATLPLIEALEDSSARVREAAAIALAKLGDSQALEPIRRAHRSAKGLSRRRMGRSLRRLEARSRSQGRKREKSSKFTRRWIAIEQKLEFLALVKSLAWNAIKGKDRNQNRAEAVDQARRMFGVRPEEEVFEFLENAVKEFPEDPELRVLYASILLAFRIDDVAEEAEKAAELGRNDPVILVRAGHLLLNRGEVEAARSCAARANELAAPEFLFYPELLNLDGHLATRNGNDELAEESFRLAVKREPSGGMLAVDLAKFLAERDRQEEALEVIEEALTQAKHTESLERLRGEILD